MKKDQKIDLDYFKKKLLNEQTTLIDGLKMVSKKNPSNPNDWEPTPENLDILSSDRNEVADKIGSFEGDIAILKELEPQLKDVRLALEKIEAGNYGKCEICGKEISKERLEANPAARTCIEHINERVT